MCDQKQKLCKLTTNIVFWINGQCVCCCKYVKDLQRLGGYHLFGELEPIYMYDCWNLMHYKYLKKKTSM